MSDVGLVILDEAECNTLLATQRVGRVAVCGAQPAVLPVVFAVHDGDIVFRTAPGEKLIAAALQRTVVFEVDDYDVESESGWSVNVVGTASEVTHPDELT